MSQREFEAYLTLLSKLLNLSPAQRNDVADELRDHLEERMTQLAAEGLAPDDAAHRAVSELGDAAGLARELSRPKAALRRRRILRWGFSASVATAIAAFLFWPTPHPVAPAPVVAQAPAAPIAGGGLIGGPTVSPAEKRRAAVEKKLDQDVKDTEFDATPVRDALQYLSEVAEVPILIDRRRIEEAGVEFDGKINFTVKAGDVSFRTALEMILSEVDLIYLVREGVIVVTTRSEEPQQYEVRVYPCSDLLAAGIPQVAAAEGGEGSSLPMAGTAPPGAVPAAGAAVPMGAGFGAAPAGAAGGPMAAGAGKSNGKNAVFGAAYRPRSTHPAGAALLDLVQTMTDGPWLEVSGEGGNLREYGGMLIVRHKQSVHRQIEELLTRMREKRAK